MIGREKAGPSERAIAVASYTRAGRVPERPVVGAHERLEPSTLARTSARTWGQMITGKFQDAIASAFDDMAAKRPK